MTICALLAFACSTFADDSFSVDDVTVPQNGEADVVVRFSLDAGSTCSGYTFWLQLPKELAFVTYIRNDETKVTYTAGDCYDETPTLTPNIDAGYLKVGCLTANSDPIIGTTGTLVTFRLKVVGEAAVGTTYTGKLTKGTISAQDGTVHDVADATFTITIAEPEDGRIVFDEEAATLPDYTADQTASVRVKRTIKANEWSTICLPFAIPATQMTAVFGEGVEVAKFSGWKSTEFDDDDNVTAIEVAFTDVTAIEANTPYIIKVKEATSELLADNVVLEKADDEPYASVGKMNRGTFGSFTGSYVPVTIDEECLFLNSNKFWYSTGKTVMKGYRGYFYFQEVLASYSSGAGARISFHLDETTGIRDNNREAITNNRYYDLQGRRVENPSKGLYIRNGKKEIVK